MPSRRKLAMEVAKAQAEAALLDLDLKRRQLDLVDARKDRGRWESRAESMRAENEVLQRQMKAMLPNDRFVRVRGWNASRDEVMRSLHFPPGCVSIGVDVQWSAFERRDCGPQVNVAFKEALVDRICREVKEKVVEQLRWVG